MNVKVDKKKTVVTIDIEANINKMGELYLSRFSDKIQYIPLETNIENVFPKVTTFSMSDKYILASDNRSILLFNNKGHFITKFGTKGRGPGEYQFINNLILSNNLKIYLKSLYDLFEYNTDGTLLNRYKNTFRSNNGHFISKFCMIDDSLLFCHIQNSTGKANLKAAIINKKGMLKQTYKNYIIFDRQKEIANSLEGEAFFQSYNGSIFYKDVYNDTLFQVDAEYVLIPKYVFKLGKYKEPLSERAKPLQEWNPTNYITINGVFQTEKYFFLSYQFGKYFPAKRITPKTLNLPTGEVVSHWYDTQIVIGVLDKKTGVFSFSKPTNSDNRLFTTGIYNDFDGGPRFIPDYMINDSTMVMFLTAEDLKNHIASSDFKNSDPKFPDKKRELEILASKISEFDNPILMIITVNK